MNCDTAFELMTESDGSRSLALARHLDDCPRCRAMQATLAPALEFLAPGLPGDNDHESAAFAAGGSATRRPPVVTAEALAVARQCAETLAARSSAPVARLQRAAVNGLRYAAVFAAGIVLAFTLFEARHGAPPDGGAKACTRHEAARTDAKRTTAAARALALSCAGCHAALENQPEKPASSLNSNRTDDREWLQQLLCDDTLIAGTARCGGLARRGSAEA